MGNLVYLAADTGGVFDLVVLLIVFAGILAAAFYASKWVAKSGMNLQKNKNVRILEVVRLNQTKYIYVVKMGDKTVALGVTKDHMEYLCELNEESLEFEQSTSQGDSFKDFLKLSLGKKEE